MTAARYHAALSERARTLAIRMGYHSRPSFLIIGAQKAGTTALHGYLAEHPAILPAQDKELGFFSPEIFSDWPEHPNHAILCTREGTVFDHPRSYRQATTWYHGRFPWPHELGRNRLTFEATPEYLYYPRVPRRIFEYDPAMKLIILLRDPVARAFSAWNMYRNFGGYRPFVYAPRRETRDFPTAIREEMKAIESGVAPRDPGYVRRGLYHEQLERYLQLFDRRQILVLHALDLERRTGNVLERVAEFLEIEGWASKGQWQRILIGEYESPIDEASRRLLREFYAPHNRELYGVLQHDFGW